jgi:hypothetical protein
VCQVGVWLTSAMIEVRMSFLEAVCLFECLVISSMTTRTSGGLKPYIGDVDATIQVYLRCSERISLVFAFHMTIMSLNYIL